MKSFASETFFENFQIASELTPVAEWTPPGPPGAAVVIDLVGDRHLFLDRRDIRADRVVDPGTLAREEEAIVRGVVPREHLGLHRVPIELLVPLDRLGRLVAVDR